MVESTAADEEVWNESILTDSEILLGATPGSLTDKERVMSNPHLKKLFNKMLDDRIKQAMASESGESSKSRLLTMLTPPQNKQSGLASENIVSTKENNVVKSPSDTTIYVRALAKNKTPPVFQRNMVVNETMVNESESPVVITDATMFKQGKLSGDKLNKPNCTGSQDQRELMR